ncbi:hypothetical protein V1264_019131 [Littorina saxatilis]|uniref:Calponin-homology (CH) domain-containing protein n=1 Tax=Littorina saxatilis TaxID=31220 RepID=A0AAN9BJP4_9CAEN
MIPLIFKRKKTAEYLRQNSGEQDDRKKHGQQSSRARTLEDHYSGNTSFSGHSSFDTGEPGSNPGYARQGSGGNNSGCDGSGVGGSGGGYLATGGYNYSYDYGGGVGGGGRGVGGRGGGVRGGSPQPVRRSPSPLGSGEWALRECENHTTWLNDLRKRLGQPQITDLRTAVADGITLVQLTEALTKSEVRQTDHDRLLSKPQALVNLDRCLAHLAACGVDVIGIQANDLVEGDLKSSLLLLTQIRRRYDSVQSLRTQGDGEHTGGNGGGGRGGQGGGGTERVTVHPSRWSPDLEMPGRIDTSPRLSRATHTTDKVSPRMRRGQAVDEDRMIPGMMTSEEHVMSSGHQNLKHTDSERPARQFSSNNTSSTKPSPAPRTHGPMTSERPPSQLGVAWAADSAAKPRQVPPPCNHGNSSHSNTVKDVEQSLESMKIGGDKKRPIHYV